MTAEIQGSWFPTGYYGHFRSKSRADFICEYRQLARPLPPKKFVVRSKEPTKNMCSSHDKTSIFNDAIFPTGLGRRRVPNSTYQFKNDFITWMPEREFIEKSYPLTSTYKVDYMSANAKNQLLTKRPKTSFEGVPTTSYRYAHGKSAPNKDTIDAMNNEALRLSLLNRKDRAMTAVNRGRESVASCLTWSSFKPNLSSEQTLRSMVPPATQTSEFIPHPPTAPKPETSMAVSQPPVQQAWPAPEAAVTQQQQAQPPSAEVQAPPHPIAE
ncbi:uncharacterized protein LOC123529342 [Mercenaria mercenaria]|uniref:uncharacterized protein LOC123529342 n=1 Tax=Mercenaria mercenaria TaxID=6596 RepID=UPI00234E6FA9|nr:uncharacterized protein LOC123529342 [Mercenaria mercenaria]